MIARLAKSPLTAGPGTIKISTRGASSAWIDRAMDISWLFRALTASKMMKIDDDGVSHTDFELLSYGPHKDGALNRISGVVEAGAMKKLADLARQGMDIEPEDLGEGMLGFRLGMPFAVCEAMGVPPDTVLVLICDEAGDICSALPPEILDNLKSLSVAELSQVAEKLEQWAFAN